MGRSEDLARRFEAANNALIKHLEGISDQDFTKQCADEGEKRSAGVVAHHVASSHALVAGVAAAIANGQPTPPITREMIDQGNAQHAQQFAGASRQDTVALLRSGGAQAASLVRTLSDEQLDRKGTLIGNEMTAQGVIEMVLIGHPEGHLKSITG